MINKQLEEINREDLEELINNNVSESKTIEYKQQLPPGSDNDKKEFLADISSFANASGGDLIYGIQEKNGSPIKIKEIKIENIDGEILKYNSIIRDGIKPRINFETHPIMISDKKFVIIFRIHKSWIGPHRVIFGGHDKFYSRSSNGKYSLDVNDLRIAFTMSQTLIEQINKFKIDRIAQIISGDIPINAFNGGKIVLHLIPLESFSRDFKIDLNLRDNYPLDPLFSTMIGEGWTPVINFEGILRYSKSSYVQLYRNGIIEAFESYLLNTLLPEGEKAILIENFEYGLVESLNKYLDSAKSLGINMPIVVFLTLIGIKGYKLWISSNPAQNAFHNLHNINRGINRDILQLPETVIESYDTRPEDILRPMFDIIWNACGFERSFNFDKDGNLIRK